MKKVDVYTDGACSGNPGIGGWAAILLYNGAKKEIFGYDKHTTNNRMELFAVVMGLRALKESCDVTVYTDSAYVANAFINGWIYNWLANKWKTADKKEVKNSELWKALYYETKKHKIQFVKVKGQADNENNNRCDALATGAISDYVELINSVAAEKKESL